MSWSKYLDIALALLACTLSSGCDKLVIFEKGQNGRCGFTGNAGPATIIASCGLPDGIRYRPKVFDVWSWGVCSAPIYTYGEVGIAFGCNGHYADIAGSDDGLALGSDDLISDIERGHHAVASIAQLRHQALNADQRTRAIGILAKATASEDSSVRRAAERTLAGLTDRTRPH